MSENLKKCLKLYGQFLTFGSFTFGGGWSIVAQMKDLYVDKEKSITDEELLDITSIGRSLPGTMIGNIAVFYGHRVSGFWGGIACVFGMITVPMLVLMIITTFYSAFQDNIWVASAMKGVRAAVAARIYTVGVNTGPLPNQVLADEGASLVFNCMADFGACWMELVSFAPDASL